MTPKQNEIAIAVTCALASRKPTSEQLDLIERCKIKCPKLFAMCQRVAPKVRRNVDEYMLGTWTDFLEDEKAAEEMA